MLDVGAARENARAVPLADLFEMPGRRRIEPVVPAGARQACLVVCRLEIVQELVLGAGCIDPIAVLLVVRVIRILDTAVKNAAVAGASDLPVELELEVPELVARD